MKTLAVVSLCQVAINEALNLPAWTIVLASVIGAFGVTLFQMKKGDSAANAAGKALLGFGCGFYLGSYVATKLSVDRLAGSFIGAFVSPVLVATIENKVKGWFTKP